MANQNILVYTIDFFRTINQKAKRNLLNKDVLYLAQNSRFDDETGAVSKRKPRAKYNTVFQPIEGGDM